MQKVLVKNSEEGINIAKNKLYEIVDQKTLLCLSGGSTPKPLYQSLACEKKLKVGAVGLVDERYGRPLHKDSNEKMIQETGFIEYLKAQNIAFYPILHKKKTQERVAKEYNETVRYLLTFFPKSVAILGIGEDGHTAGLPAEASLANVGIAKEISNPRNSNFVTYYSDSKNISEGGYGRRITLTFKAMRVLDILIILAFGEKKKRALREIFKQGSLQQIPARFYLKPQISKKTLLITDQKI